jgi:hypothetical protein
MGPRRIAVAGYPRADIQPHDFDVDDKPVAARHDPVCATGAAQDECSERIAGAGTPQLIQLQHCKVRLLAGSNRTDIVTTKTARLARR